MKGLFAKAQAGILDSTRLVKHPSLVGLKLSLLYSSLTERKKATATAITSREGFTMGIISLGRGKQPLLSSTSTKEGFQSINIVTSFFLLPDLLLVLPFGQWVRS